MFITCHVISAHCAVPLTEESLFVCVGYGWVGYFTFLFFLLLKKLVCYAHVFAPLLYTYNAHVFVHVFVLCTCICTIDIHLQCTHSPMLYIHVHVHVHVYIYSYMVYIYLYVYVISIHVGGIEAFQPRASWPPQSQECSQRYDPNSSAH